MSDGQQFRVWADSRTAALRKQIAEAEAELAAISKVAHAYLSDQRAAQAKPKLIFNLPPNRPGKQADPESKSSRILDFIRQSGDSGRSLTEIYKFAEENGIADAANKNIVRGLVWGQKQRGRVVANGDRYIAATSVKQEGPPEDGPSS